MDSVPANADVHVEINQNPVDFESQMQSNHQQPQRARVTTATHPTTSTQTRSTARPQVHATGIPVGQIRNLRPPMQLSSFDRYLPCNSHHIHEPEIQQISSNQNQQSQNQPSPSQPIQRGQRLLGIYDIQSSTEYRIYIPITFNNN